MKLRSFYLGLLCCLLTFGGQAQSTDAGTQAAAVSLSLDQAIDMALNRSVNALIAQNRLTNQEWRFRSYRADLRPSLGLNGTIPNFNRTITGITQDDGSQIFVSQSLANSSLNFNLSQEIAPTGGSIFAGSGLQRIDLFQDSTTITSYLSSPFFIGLRQPILRYNRWKWLKQIEPLRMQEANRAYLEEREEVSIQVINLFFALHEAEINREIAATNLANNDTIYQISKGRYNLGKIAQNDLLQMELRLLNSQVAMSQADNELKNAASRLRRILTLPETAELELVIPHLVPALQVDAARAMEFARLYRSSPVAFERQQLEAEQEVANARGSTGFQADLTATYGLNNTGETIGDAFQQPENFQNLGLSFSVPILDWGKARAQREIAVANQELVEASLELDNQNFEQQVLLEVDRFNLQANQVAIAAKADTVSRLRFEVTKQRYLIGKIDILDLNIASTEQDQARRAYISALRNYWNSFYSIRRLTLYDFVADQPIK